MIQQKQPEMEAKRLSKVQRLDIINILPQSITESILSLLRIEEAARTSILSRAWRYKWTTIPKVVFYEDLVKRSREDINRNQLSDLEIERRDREISCKHFYAILQVLLLRQAPIHEFYLSVTSRHTFFEIDHVIRHLLKNHMVKKLTLDFFYSRSNGLPLSVFSLHHLTDLDLDSCNINHKPIFNGFGSLTSLSLNQVTISTETLLHLLSNCSSLKRLYLLALDEHFFDSERPKSVEPLPNIMELFKCLPVIEHLTTWDHVIELFALDLVPQGLSTSLIHLKYFCFEDLSFANVYGLTFLAVLVKCSPNLEKIKLEIDTVVIIDVESVKQEEYFFIFEELSKFWLEHLNELEIKDYMNFKPLLEFVKFILARSPNLKKVILLAYMDDKNEVDGMLTILLNAPRASPVVIVENRCKDLENDD